MINIYLSLSPSLSSSRACTSPAALSTSLAQLLLPGQPALQQQAFLCLTPPPSPLITSVQYLQPSLPGYGDPASPPVRSCVRHLCNDNAQLFPISLLTSSRPCGERARSLSSARFSVNQHYCQVVSTRAW